MAVNLDSGSVVHQVSHRRRMLRSEQAVLAVVRRQPGLTVRGVSRQAKMSPTTAINALQRLEAQGIVRREPQGGALRCYADNAPAQILIPTQGVILEALRNGPQRQIDLIAALARLGIRRSTAQYRLQRMVAANLIQSERVGGRVLYQAPPPAAAVAPGRPRAPRSPR